MSDKLIEAAVRFLELDKLELDARVRARGEPMDDDLYRAAHMLGEYREDARRILADEILDRHPELTARVRAAVRFSMRDAASGAVMGSWNPNNSGGVA